MTLRNFSEAPDSATPVASPERRVYIPDIGDTLELRDPWTFMVYCESRNFKLIEALKKTDATMTKGWHLLYRMEGYGHPLAQCTLPAGSILQVDRVYIRQGLGNFSSITFKFKNARLAFPDIAEKGKNLVRFWAKLEEVNLANMVKV